MTKTYWAKFRWSGALASIHPIGIEIAYAIRDHLSQCGLHVGAIENWRDSGYSVDCELDGKRVYFFVSLFADTINQWVLCCSSDLGTFAKILGRSDDDQRLVLAKHISDVTRDDGRFHDVCWCLNWRGGENDSWASSPDGL